MNTVSCNVGRMSILMPLQGALLLGCAGLFYGLPFFSVRILEHFDWLAEYSYSVYLFQFIAIRLWPEEFVQEESGWRSDFGLPSLAAYFQVKIFQLVFLFGRGVKYQNTTKISKYVSIQNSKISAVSRPILTTKAPFFSIFQVLPENTTEYVSKSQKLRKTFAPKFGFFGKCAKYCCILIFWLYSVF